jgi:hypothetical protein
LREYFRSRCRSPATALNRYSCAGELLAAFCRTYASARKNKALALGPGCVLFFPIALETVEETVRRALESCGGIADVPCMIVALNDSFVVPIPATLKVIGFFKAADDITRCPPGRGTPDGGCAERLERGRGWNGRQARTGIEGGHRTGRGRWRVCRLRQARQQLSGYCDWSVFGRTELDHDFLVPEFDPSGPGELAELRMTVGLRPLANSMNKFRYP